MSKLYIELTFLNYILPTLSLGISLSSDPCLRKTFPKKQEHNNIVTIVSELLRDMKCKKTA